MILKCNTCGIDMERKRRTKFPTCKACAKKLASENYQARRKGPYERWRCKCHRLISWKEPYCTNCFELRKGKKKIRYERKDRLNYMGDYDLVLNRISCEFSGCKWTEGIDSMGVFVRDKYYCKKHADQVYEKSRNI